MSRLRLKSHPSEVRPATRTRHAKAQKPARNADDAALPPQRRVIVCDDNSRQAEAWSTAIRAALPRGSGLAVQRLELQEFQDALGGLEARRRMARARSRTNSDAEAAANAFDRAAILVVDYDLLKFEHERGYLTGDIVAYLARCYSKCGVIVGLNRFGRNPFDLTLSGHPELFADLHIGGAQAGNRGLWRPDWSGFRPWVWPLLPESALAMERRVADVLGHEDDEILEVFGFPGEVVDTMPRSALAFLSTGKVPERTTFKQFIDSSGEGLRKPDKTEPAYRARIAASRLSKWLERHLLAGQDLLVDAPHLVSRFPSLLGVRDAAVAGLKTWNRMVTLGHTDELPGQLDSLKDFQFHRAYWLSRPAWYWRPLSRSATIAELQDPWTVKPVPYVFCEDISAFVPQVAAQEFVAAVESSYTRRYIVNRQTSEGAVYGASTAGVDYQPRVRLAL
jgi:hypothetical protein